MILLYILKIKKRLKGGSKQIPDPGGWIENLFRYTPSPCGLAWSVLVRCVPNQVFDIRLSVPKI